MRQPPAHPLTRRLPPLAALLVVLASAAAAPASAGSGRSDPDHGHIELREAAPPPAAARVRMRRWSRVWSARWSTLSGAYGRLVTARRAGRRLSGLPGCEDLGRGLLALDRERLFPVPDPVVERHLRRALERLARTAVECLRGRPHAAGYALDRARRALAATDRALARYRPEASDPAAGTRGAGASSVDSGNRRSISAKSSGHSKGLATRASIGASPSSQSSRTWR